jgi:hypothetical protein
LQLMDLAARLGSYGWQSSHQGQATERPGHQMHHVPATVLRFMCSGTKLYFNPDSVTVHVILGEL